MTIHPGSLRIVHYPDPALRRRGVAIPAVTAEVRAVAARMIGLMREAEGIGLAAPQVGLAWRLFVADVPPNEERSAQGGTGDGAGDGTGEGDGTGGAVSATDGARVYINPVISGPAGPAEPYDEGCLSLPEITGEVLRPPTVTISALDIEGRAFTQTGTGLLARCWQHEMDHLDGVLIIDRMSQMSRLKNRAALKEMERAAETKPKRKR